MTRSLTRWFAIITLVMGAISPNLGKAQVVMSLTDDDDPTYPIGTWSEDDPPPAAPSASDLYVSSGRGCAVGCDSCGASSCLSCCDSCYVPRDWFSGDYLLWWTKGNTLPSLVTTSPAGTAQVAAGVLPGATTLFGGTAIDDEARSGLRLTYGHWADPDGTVGWQVTYFSVFDDENTGDFAATGVGGAPILARPFFNMALGAEDSRLISFPAVVDGTININSSSEMHSVSWVARQHWKSGSKGRIDLIGGYRYFRFREGLRFQESLVSTNPGGVVPVGTTFTIEDLFVAENDFHGGDLGFIAEFWNPGWTLEFLAKVALGNLHRSADISGFTVTDVPPAGGGVTTNGGLLALPTNIGRRRGNDFAALPEFGVNFKFEPRQNVSFNVGYSLLMLNDVVRTGELIDRGVNPTQLSGGPLVGAARPTSLFGTAETDFWAQGLSFGLTFSR
jgi:hypothetical protein